MKTFQITSDPLLGGSTNHEIRFHDDENRISWLNNQIGNYELRVTSNSVRKWTEISAKEWYVTEKNRVVEKHVMMGLSEEQGLKLYQQLHQVYGQKIKSIDELFKEEETKCQN